MRKTICRSERLTVLVVGALLVPAAASAQVQADTSGARADSAGAVHVVRRGDTLWDLAIQYLRNPRRWPDIHQANRDVVENPHRIYPGERLRIPGTAAPADAVATEQPGPTAPATVGVVGVVRVTGEQPDSAGGGSFVVSPATRTAAREDLAARRLADYLAAPYLDRVGGPAGAGQVHATGAMIGSDAVGSRWLQLGDDVRLTLPTGDSPAVGQRLVTYALGPVVGGGQVVRPTGIVEVSEFEGRAARGRIIVVLDAMQDGQRVMPLPPVPGEPVTGTAGAGARVAWVEGDSPVPGLQTWLLLSPAAGATLAEQDEVQLYRRPDRGAPASGDVEVLGTARIVRVTPFGAAAIVTAVAQPGITVGTPARVAAH